MEDYFANMAKGKIGPSDMYVINQKRRGIGQSRRGKAIYRIPTQSGAGQGPVISPIAQGIVQAATLVKKKGVRRTGIKRKRVGSRSHSSKKRRTVKTSGTRKRKPKSKAKSSVKKVRRTTRKKKKTNLRDIFS